MTTQAILLGLAVLAALLTITAMTSTTNAILATRKLSRKQIRLLLGLCVLLLLTTAALAVAAISVLP